MKVSALPILVVGAGLAALQVSATPIRIVVVSSQQEVTSNLRFGHALGNNDGNVAHVVRPDGLAVTATTELQAGPRKHSCFGAIRNKAIDISNTFRHVLGLPSIEKGEHKHKVHAHHGPKASNGLIQILPMPFIGTPVINGSVLSAEDGEKLKAIEGHQHHMHLMHHRGSFLRRVHHALMALGPWEGRAVAFVLGCGIGVLIRMLWVLSVVTFRMIHGENEEEGPVEWATFVVEENAEDSVAPPQYSQIEKAGVAEADAKPIEA